VVDFGLDIMSREIFCRFLFPLLVVFVFLTFSCSLGFGSPTVNGLLRHKGFDWRSATTEHFQLHFEANSLAEARIEVLKLLQEKSFVRNLKLLGASQYPYGTDAFIVSSRERMKELIGRETNGIAFPDKKIVCFIFNEKQNAGGAHELMHVMARNLWTGNPKTWINEGLAVYADDQWWGHKLHDLNKYLLQGGKLIPLEKLIEHLTDYSDMIVYPEAGSFLKYLYEQYGIVKVRQLWAHGDTQDFQRVFGEDLATLEREWHSELMRADSNRIRYDFSPKK